MRGKVGTAYGSQTWHLVLDADISPGSKLKNEKLDGVESNLKLCRARFR